MAFRPSPTMIDAAKTELAGRARSLPKRVEAGEISSEAAEQSLSAWRAIESLLSTGETLGGKDLWPRLVEAVQAAVEHRAAKNDPRTPALRQIRSILIRSAIRAGATL